MSHFVYTEPAEEAHFDNAPLAGVDFGQAMEAFIEFDDLDCFQIDHSELIIEPGGSLSAPALLPQAGAGVIDEDLPHQVRGDGQEVSAAFPGSIMLQS